MLAVRVGVDTDAVAQSLADATAYGTTSLALADAVEAVGVDRTLPVAHTCAASCASRHVSVLASGLHIRMVTGTTGATQYKMRRHAN